MPNDDRGRFAGLIRDVMRDKGFNPNLEFKWNKITPASRDFYLALVDIFFKTRFIVFHCIIFDLKAVDAAPCHEDAEVRLQIRLHEFLTNKMQRCLRKHPDKPQTFRLWVDPLPVRYRKADEALHIIANNALQKVVGVRPIDKVITRDSKKSPSIELCDVLLGAVRSTWEGNVTSPAKLAVQQRIAAWLGSEASPQDLRPVADRPP